MSQLPADDWVIEPLPARWRGQPGQLAGPDRKRQITPMQLEAILDGAADGVIARDPAGQLVYANDAAAHLCGYETIEAMQGASTDELLSRFAILDDDGRPLAPALLPGRQVLDGYEAPETIVRYRVYETGEERWSLVHSTPIRDAAGRLQLAVSIFRDITERKRTEDGARFLAAASQALSESLEYEVTLQRVAQLAVPALADWCVVDLVEDGRVRRLAIAHVNVERVALAHELQQRYPDDPQASAGVAHVLRTGQPEMLEEITDAMLEAGARDTEHLRLLRELELRSYLIVPLVARGHTLGAITLVGAESGRRYGPSDLVLAENLAGRAALALDNARLYREAQEQTEAHAQLNAALRDAINERDTAAARLEQALRTREDFLASAAHDLKNPLTVMKGHIQLIERRARTGHLEEPLRLADRLQAIAATVTRAAGQVDELLDLAHLEMGRSLELQCTPTDIIDLLRAVVAEHQQASTRHDLRLGSDEARMMGNWDGRRLARVLGNLIDNAIKYSPDGGRIDVRVLREEVGTQEYAVVAVQDSGIGIPADDTARVFERFERASNVPGRIAGTGIGLASARSIVESHGGSIGVQSYAGQGSTFTIRLPLRAHGAGSEDSKDVLVDPMN
jgi:PAS domain S-box-containing protein